MPKSWTTKEQLQWLNARRNDFLEAQKQDMIPEWLTEMNEMWFSVFSEFKACFPNKDAADMLSPEEEERLEKAIKHRKDQLSNWFRYHTKSTGSPASSGLNQFFKLLQSEVKEVKRAPHECEIYSKLYPEKVASVYTERKQTNMSAIQVCNLKRAIANELLKQEGSEIQQKVRDEVTRCKEEQVEALKKKATEFYQKKMGRTPEEYQSALDDMPTFLALFMDALAEATGWTFVVVGGGPRPMNNGKLWMADYQFGNRTAQAGNTFSTAYINFKANVKDPFSQYLGKCFLPHVRSSRALKIPAQPEQEPGNAMCVDDMAFANNAGDDGISLHTTEPVPIRDDRVAAQSSAPVQETSETVPAIYRPQPAVASARPTPVPAVHRPQPAVASDRPTPVPAVHRPQPLETPVTNGARSDPDSPFASGAVNLPYQALNVTRSVPGGPNEPVEFAFMRMNNSFPTSFHIDPVLREVQNPSVSEPSSRIDPTLTGRHTQMDSQPSLPQNHAFEPLPGPTPTNTHSASPFEFTYNNPPANENDEPSDDSGSNDYTLPGAVMSSVRASEVAGDPAVDGSSPAVDDVSGPANTETHNPPPTQKAKRGRPKKAQGEPLQDSLVNARPTRASTRGQTSGENVVATSEKVTKKRGAKLGAENEKPNPKRRKWIGWVSFDPETGEEIVH